ncbi:Putative DNA-binding protein [Alloactinosynnema sp. L-07]|uniref:helix-turn-helix domain-containing protein n=1 Tax=Alloactinosynnema sp. L-07 TaxID=1653480 RepID=UPI00065EFF19|nr:helix-turn-helix transcriptional regulator [Alloactinosynnema sp. L-07]CRK60162.1 Putative DNA-binding protein [Alloactinosynnema sp. L-07]
MGARNRASTRELGELLRTYREAAGLTMRELGERIGRNLTSLHRIETGVRGATSESEVVHYMAACGASPKDVLRAIDVCRETTEYRGYWLSPHDRWMSDSLRSFIFHESRASKTVIYESELIPGLLQTEPYVRALFARVDMPDEGRTALIQTRLARQHVMFRNNPAKFTFFIQERALKLEVGDYRIMAEQLLAMLFFADRWNISIRIVPAKARELALFGGPFQLLAYDRCPTLAYLDGPFGGVFLEEPKYVAPFLKLNRELAGIALDAGESRALIASLADEYDRSEGSWDDTWKVAQEQL